MTVFVVVFLFSHSVLDGELQLALDLTEEIINEYIIIFLIQFILNSYQFKPIFQFLRFLKQIECVKYTDKRWLATLEFGS